MIGLIGLSLFSLVVGIGFIWFLSRVSREKE